MLFRSAGAGVVEQFIDTNHFRALSFQEGDELPQNIPMQNQPVDGGGDGMGDGEGERERTGL